MAEDNIIYIGKKPTMNYVLAVVTQFQQDESDGQKKVIIKARGRTISQAVDVAEIVRNRFVKNADIDRIEIGTENLTNNEGRNSNVSFIEIVLIIE